MENVYDIKQNKHLDFILPINYVSRKKAIFNPNLRILVIIHLYYLDTVEMYMEYVKNIPLYIDVLFTFSDQKVKKKIYELVNSKRKNYKIIEKKNRGRDISSFLVACRDEILKYNIISFLHDKKEKSDKEKVDVENWIQNLWGNTIGSTEYIENLLELFEEKPLLGVVAPPPPLSEHFSTSYANAWGNNFLLTEMLAKKLNLTCKLEKEKPPLTFGTVFWARVTALRKLFEVEWKYEDFDEEPLKDDGTISHAIERILAYVAQDVGFETGWVMNDLYAAKRFEYTQDILTKAFGRLEKSLGIRYISELNSYEERVQEILSFINKYDCFYIYGVGVLGKKCFTMLKDVHKFPSAFLVSELELVSKEYQEVPIYSVSQVNLNKNCGIIVAVGKRYQKEIIEGIHLKNPCFCNIYIYRNE